MQQRHTAWDSGRGANELQLQLLQRHGRYDDDSYNTGDNDNNDDNDHTVAATTTPWDSGRGASEPDAVAAGGTAEHNGAMRQQSCMTLPTADSRGTANHYGQAIVRVGPINTEMGKR